MQAIMFLAPDLREDGSCQMNYDDKNMLSSLLDWKEAAVCGTWGEEVRLSLIAMGPPEAKPIVREALAMGADRALLLIEQEEFFDPLGRAGLLVEAVLEMGEFQLLCAGGHSRCDVSFLMTAELLGLPAISQMTEFSVVDGGIMVSRSVPEGGEHVFMPFGSFLSNGWKREKIWPISFLDIQDAMGKELLVRELPIADGQVLLQGKERYVRKGLVRRAGEDAEVRSQILKKLAAVCYSG